MIGIFWNFFLIIELVRITKQQHFDKKDKDIFSYCYCYFFVNYFCNYNVKNCIVMNNVIVLFFILILFFSIPGFIILFNILLAKQSVADEFNNGFHFVVTGSSQAADTKTPAPLFYLVILSPLTA